jgi:hydrogenase maturation protease
MKQIKVIGCGSLLMGDDAAGCIAARKLQGMELPPKIKIIEAGTPGLNLLNIMKPGEHIIIIDAVCTGEKPGTIAIFSEDDLPAPLQMPASAHQLAIPETIALGRAAQPELMPENIEIWGIEIELPVKMKMELSPEVENAIDRLVYKLAEKLKL